MCRVCTACAKWGGGAGAGIILSLCPHSIKDLEKYAGGVMAIFRSTSCNNMLALAMLVTEIAATTWSSPCPPTLLSGTCMYTCSCSLPRCKVVCHTNCITTTMLYSTVCLGNLTSSHRLERWLAFFFNTPCKHMYLLLAHNTRTGRLQFVLTLQIHVPKSCSNVCTQQSLLTTQLFALACKVRANCCKQCSTVFTLFTVVKVAGGARMFT